MSLTKEDIKVVEITGKWNEADDKLLADLAWQEAYECWIKKGFPIILDSEKGIVVGEEVINFLKDRR